MSFKKIFAILSVLVVVGSIGAVFYILLTQSFSKDKVRLEIIAPDKVEVGEEVTFIVKLKNDGDIRLDDTVLTFLYPEGSIVEGNEFLRQTIEMDSLYPGEEKSFTFKGRIFGREGDFREAKAFFRYKPKNLNSEFESSTSKLIEIERVPINLSMSLPAAIEPPAKVDIEISYLSNIDIPLSDITIFLEYPLGFSFISSEPSAIDENQWDITELEEGKGGRIKIKGEITGDIGEEKTFKAKIGIWREGEFVVLKEVLKTIRLEKVDLILSKTVNGSESYIAEPGELLHYVISFQNIGEKDLSNLFMVVNLDNDILDLNTLKVVNGKYNARDNVILFDSSTNPIFNLLKSGEEGKVEFFVNVKDINDLRPANDVEAVISVFISKIREEFITKIQSKPLLSTSLLYEDEVFGNIGPNPPQIGQETTYTIIWNIKNKINTIKDIKISGVLPQFVSIIPENIFPEEEKARLSFDDSSREVSLSIEKLSPNEEKSVAFQVKVSPRNEKDLEDLAVLKDIKVFAFDEWIQDNIEYTFDDLRILPKDEEQQEGNDGQNNNQ